MILGNSITGGASSLSFSSGENSSHDGHSRCILLAEDDADDVFLVRRSFRKAGLSHRILDVGDGAIVIDYLSGKPPFDDRARHPFPDLLLLDLKMPKLNGFDVLTWLKGRPDMGGLPVILLSSSSFEADREMALRMGAREFHTKPGDLHDVIPLLRGLHERWLAHSQFVPDSWRSVPQGQQHFPRRS